MLLAGGLERIDSRFERSSADGKMLSIKMQATERSFVKGKANQCSKPHSYLILGNFHGHPNLTCNRCHLTSRQSLTSIEDSPLVKELELVKGQ